MDDKIAYKIASQVEDELIGDGILDYFRQRVEAFARVMRKYQENDRLWHFEVAGYFAAIKKFSELRNKKAEPDHRTVKDFIKFMREFPETYIKKYK